MNHENEYKMRYPKKGDEESLEKLYIMGGEKLLPWFYDKYFEKIFYDIVRTNNIIGKALIIERDNEILGVIDAYPSDKKRGAADFKKIIRKHIKYFDMLKFLFRLKKNQKYFKKPKGSYHISILAVFDKYRRKGIGSKLISHVEELAKKEGCTSLYLEVQSNNIPAIKIYEKHGFFKVKELSASKLSKKLVGKNDLKIIFMQKNI